MKHGKDGIPRNIGGYQIIEQVGKGGMGVVYKAFQKSLNRHVALKVLPDHLARNELSIKTLEREARAAADLKHPHIATVYDFGHEGDTYFFAMEFVDGRTLEQIIPDRKVAFKEKLGILGQAARALDYAHSRGVIHRDVKPSNIMVNKEGQVLLMDFGLVQPENQQVAPDPGSSDSTEIGTPGYIAPEQAYGQRLDRRADIYSLGAILYDIISFHQAPRRINHDDPNDIEAVSLKALSHHKGRRYATAREFYEDIGHYLNDEPVRARPGSVFKRLYKKFKKNRRLSITVGSLLAVVIGLGAFQVVQVFLERARWRLVFADNFERAALGSNWQAYASIWIDTSRVERDRAERAWGIQQGRLVCDDRFHTFVVLDREITGDIRWEYDACMEDDFTDGIDCFLFSKLVHGDKIDDLGYAFCFGAMDQTRSYIKRYSYKIDENIRRLPVPQKWYHIRVERTGYNLTYRVDGKTLLHAQDYFSIIEPEACRLGFHSWKGKTYYDNLKVYRSTLPLKSHPLIFADQLLSMGRYNEAIQQYEDILNLYPDKEIGLVAGYKVGHAHLLAQRYGPAVSAFDRVIDSRHHHPIQNLAMVEKGISYYYQGNSTQANRVFDDFTAAHPQSYYVNEIVKMYDKEAKLNQQDEKNYLKALDNYRNIIRYSKQDIPARNLLTNMEYPLQLIGRLPPKDKYRQQVKEIRELARSLADKNPVEYQECLYYLALFYHNSFKKEEAKACAEELARRSAALKKAGKITQARRLLEDNLQAHVQILLGQPKEAIIRLEKAYEEYQREIFAPRTLFILGACHILAGDYDRAEASFKKVLAEYPDLTWNCVLAEQALGHVCRLKGDYEGTRRHYQAALDYKGEADIEKYNVENSVNALCLLTENWQDVVDRGIYCTISNSLQPLFNTIMCERLYFLSLVYWHQGNLKKRDEYLKAILQQYRYQPYIPLAQYHLGRIGEAEFLAQVDNYWCIEKNDLYCGLAEDFYLRKKYAKALYYYKKAMEHSNAALQVDLYRIEYGDIYSVLCQKRIQELEKKGVK